MSRQRSISRSDDDTRQKMKKYWEVYEPSLESMMLSSEACYLSENEQNELFSYLPSYKGLRVLELGAGIGRYTGPLAEASGHVVAVDFMESYTKENEKTNGHHGNIKFICGDVTKLEFPPNSFDLVFSNWLLMYLTQDETEDLMNSILEWLKPDGHFFFRESCYHQSGNRPRSENPTHYRTPLDYVNMLQGCTMEGETCGFELISAKNILTYIAYHGNPNQLCFLSKKLRSTNKKIDAKPYEYAEPTSEDENRIKWLSSKLDLTSNQRVLNLNCNSGASSVLLVESSGAFVHGIDPNPSHICGAIVQQGKLEKHIKSRIQYEFCKISDARINPNSFDRLICLENAEDTGNRTHVKNAIILAKNCLKTGGKILLSTYVTGKNRSNNLSEDDSFSLSSLEVYLSQYDLTLDDVTQQNSTAISECRKLHSELLEEDKINEQRLKQLEFQMACLLDGRLDWDIIIASKIQ